MATAFLTGAPLGAVRLTCARTFGWAWVEVVLAAWVAVLAGLLSSPPLRTMTGTTATAIAARAPPTSSAPPEREPRAPRRSAGRHRGARRAGPRWRRARRGWGRRRPRRRHRPPRLRPARRSRW